MNRKLQEGNTTVFLTDERELSARAVQVERDSATFTEIAYDSLYHLRTREILQIQRTDRVRGTIEGAVFGGLIGATVGGCLIALGHDSGEGSGLLWVVAGGACAGATIGVIAGVVKGHTYTYRLTPTTRLPSDAPQQCDAASIDGGSFSEISEGQPYDKSSD